MSMSTEEKIRHYQRSIDRSLTDKERLLHCIEILSKLPVTVQHLQITGVGRTVNALRKIEDGVGDAAKRLVGKWKIMVANTDTSDEEDEACVPDVPESYESPDCDSDPDISVKQNRKNGSNNQPEALMQASDSPPMDIDVGTPPSTPPTTSSNDKALVSDDEEEEPRNKYATKPSSNTLKHSHSRSSNKDKSSKQDCNSKSSKDKHTNTKDNHESSKISKHSKDLEISDYKKKEKNKVKAEPSHSSSSKDKKHLEEKKRKHYSSSSDEEIERKRKKSENEEEDEDYREENNFVIYDEKSSEEEVEQQEDDDDEEDEDEKNKYCRKAKKLSSNSQSRDKESSLKGTSHSDKTKSKEKNRSSSNSKTKSHDKRSNSKVDEQGKDEKQKSDEHHSKESSKSKSSHSSSSSKDHSKDKDKSAKDKLKESGSKNRKDDKDKSKSKDDKGKCKDNKEQKERKDHKEHKKSKEDSNDQKEKKKVKKSSSGDGGIDCNSGTSFADALGMCTMPPPIKKKKENVSLSLPKSIKVEQPNPGTSTPSSSKSSPSKIKNECPNSPETLPLLSPNLKLEPLSRINEEVDLASTLPEPSPHYKPLPHLNHTQRRLNEDQMLSQVIYAKNQRTKVYSGNKTGYTNVPTLYELCIRVLIENIDALEFTGGVPYYIIKPVLERATPDQLFMLEHHNPYLIEESDSLWQFHCNKDFRTKQREEMESWREMYMRCLDEREAKLKALTANIKQSIDKSLPVRSTKLAYVDNVVKPPRSVLRKQAKYGTAFATTNASDLKKKIITGTAGPSSSSSSSGNSSSSGPPAERITVPPPTSARMRLSSSSTMKKAKAPLMAKALQAIKGRYKR